METSIDLTHLHYDGVTCNRLPVFSPTISEVLVGSI
jgi:hypothetical protein